MLLEDPDLIRPVHADYFAASADVAVSASTRTSARCEMRQGSWILERPPPDLGAAAAEWRAAGARIVVCCGTTPDDIRAM
jgi:S-methylmethionine-dependent homocysteine/selenocysteine methylase